MNNKDRWKLDSVSKDLNTDIKKGLDYGERTKRLKEHGTNKLDTKNKKPPLLLFLSQFGDVMVLMLLGATLISGALGEFYDAITIMIIVILNAILGFVQEFKAERSLEALQSLNAPNARILTNGEVQRVPAEDLVPGDIVFVRAGDRVPADIRIFNSSSLEVEESPLTGETLPVAKSEDDDYFAYSGCLVTRGQSQGVVVSTGMKTKMGSIAEMMQDAQQPPTPLQQRLSKLGHVLVVICVAISVFVFVAGVMRGEQAYKMFMAGVSLAVAAIPEGLPAVVTLCLAIGLQRMLRRKAIVRKLPAVETLGCATVICSDKTGTLTKNQMTAEKIFFDGAVLSVTGRGYDTKGDILSVSGGKPRAIDWLLTVGALCNGAQLQKSRGKVTVHGDPTDGALLVLAAKKGLEPKELRNRYHIVQEFPFDSKKKMMTVIVKDTSSGRYYSMVKGAPEIIMPLCKSAVMGGNEKVLDKIYMGKVQQTCDTWAQEAYRLLAVAWKESNTPFSGQGEAEQKMIFGGIVALNDPPRPEVGEAVRRCIKAGIKPIMITGDHKETAVAIAKRIGLPIKPMGVVTGTELEKMDDKELKKRIGDLSVCARVYPEHKMRLVRVLKEQGHVVAMTGDGVNDAPAVKEANIGIAMGIAGTEVTKEAASLVLVDDNFATIVSAVEEGRVIYDNIRKFIRFLLACNAGEVFTMFFAMLLGFPLPLKAIQILWVNLVTDGLPALALSMEPGGPGIMDRPPRARDESILARGLGTNIFSMGLVIGVLTVLVFALTLSQGREIDYARTMALTTLITVQLLFAFSCRRNDNGRAAPITSNLWLVAAIAASFGLLLPILYVPVLQMVFSTVALTAADWTLIFLVSSVPLFFRGIFRLFRR